MKIIKIKTKRVIFQEKKFQKQNIINIINFIIKRKKMKISKLLKIKKKKI